MYACIHPLPGQPAWLNDFSPLVEFTGSGTVLLDANGTQMLFGPPAHFAEAIQLRAKQEGFSVNVTMAGDPDTAIAAARGFSGITVIPPGNEARMLSSLLLRHLGASSEIVEILERWGLKTFGDFAALPAIGIAGRFGPEGIRLWKLARGESRRPLIPAREPPSFSETLELEYPLTLLEPLVFLLARLLNELCARLESHGLAANEIRLRLALATGAGHERVLRLPHPMRDSRAFLKLLQLDLESEPPAAPIVQVTLAVTPVDPRVVRNGLFLPAVPQPEKLELTLARIAHLVGRENVGAAELLDTHRPGAFRMKHFGLWPDRTMAAAGRPRLAIRVYRPPLRARVHSAGGRPVRIEARGVQGRIVSLAGPWRSSGDWWRPDAWSYDEWDLALAGGTLYRLRQDRSTGTWFITGSYD